MEPHVAAPTAAPGASTPPKVPPTPFKDKTRQLTNKRDNYHSSHVIDSPKIQTENKLSFTFSHNNILTMLTCQKPTPPTPTLYKK